MKNKKDHSLPKDIQKAIDLFPKVVAQNKTANQTKQKFADKIFGELAKKIHRELQGKKPT